jgi:peptidoglycan/xylan/chitin deacetylase (PgdA/CDA1 family)
MRTELRRTHELISETLGVSPPMFRPPYGAMSENLKSVAASMGLAIILWSVDTWDWRSKCPDEIYKEVFENIHENAGILCHDVHETTVIAMERVIPTLAERYELCTVSELMAHMNVEIKGGVIFPEGNIK